MIDLYVIAVMLTVALVNTWKNTTFKLYVCELFIKSEALNEVESTEEWEDYMLVHHGFLGELLTCPICLSHWVALGVTCLVMLVAWNCIWWLPFFTMFTAPLFVSKLVD